MVTVASPVIEGQVSAGFEAVRDAFKEHLARHDELGLRLLRLLPRQKGRRSLGRRSQQDHRRTLGARNNGCRPLGYSPLLPTGPIASTVRAARARTSMRASQGGGGDVAPTILLACS